MLNCAAMVNGYDGHTSDVVDFVTFQFSDTGARRVSLVLLMNGFPFSELRL